MSFRKSKFGSNMPMITFLGLVSLFILNLPQTQGQGTCESNGAFKEGAESHVEVRRSTRRGAKNKAEILWDPTAMLTDPTKYKVAAAELEMRQDDEENWSIANVNTRNHGKSIKWTLKLKPCKTYNFRLRVTGNDVQSKEACLPLPGQILGLDQESVAKSGYTPSSPEGFSADVHSGHAELTWGTSDCAEKYEVGYIEAGKDDNLITLYPNEETPTSVSVPNLEPCTRYETSIYAILADKYSETSTEFATEPRLDAASTLEVKTDPGLDSVQVSWPTWKSVSCIDEYKVKACVANTEECTDEESIKKSVGSPFISKKVTGLKPCTDYVLNIRPVFKDLDIEERKVEFRTHSKKASELHVDTVGSEFTSGSIFINWAPVECAAKYRVYQKEVGVEEWILAAEKSADEATETTVSEVTPCTKYQFAITAVIVDGEESETEKTTGPEVITELDETTPFKAPRFTPKAGDDKMDLIWGHADCIDSYVVKACPNEDSAYTDCAYSEAVTPGPNGNKEVSHTITGLESCTEYYVHIIPVREGKGEFTAHPESVTTTNGIPEAPQFDVALEDGTAGAEITWTPVNCASGYKIYYKVGDEEGTEDVEIVEKSEQAKIFTDNSPCQTYSYAVTTMVNEEESVRVENDWKNIVMPAKTELIPTLKMVASDQGKVTLKVDLADQNKKCSIEQYEVVYNPGEPCCDGNCDLETKTFTPDELENGDIVVNVTGDAHSTLFKARILYKEGKWSNQATLPENGEEPQRLCAKKDDDEKGGLPLIPIVVGVAVLALVVIVVTVLLIKRSRNRNFDPEKAENGNAKNTKHHENLVNSEEEKPLNEAQA